ncbi:hypothetical protein EPO04_01630 [Patescibacteria group bacterium]|nr:MAG: hypothetical protein EPO04_01630 [Patescibacteria group bacterium]
MTVAPDLNQTLSEQDAKRLLIEWGFPVPTLHEISVDDRLSYEQAALRVGYIARERGCSPQEVTKSLHEPPVRHGGRRHRRNRVREIDGMIDEMRRLG